MPVRQTPPSVTLVFVATVVVLWVFSVILALGLVRAAVRDDLITERALAIERRRSFRVLARKRDLHHAA